MLWTAIVVTPGSEVVRAATRLLPLVAARHICHHKFMASIPADRKSRGRPRVDSIHVGVRIPPEQVAPLDAWIADQPEPRPGRPEAIRLALRDWLTGLGYLPRREDPEGAN